MTPNLRYIDSINNLVIEAPSEVSMEQLIETALVRAMRNLHAIESELSFQIAAFGDPNSQTFHVDAENNISTWPERILKAAHFRQAQLEQALHVLLERMRTTTEFELQPEETLIAMS